MKMEDGNKRLVWSLEKRVLLTRRFRFIFHSSDTGILSNSSTTIHYHYLGLSLDVVFASSTKQRQFPPAVINIYILREWLRGLYFTATNLLRLIDRRILTNLAFYRNFNKPCCLSSTRRLFTRLARDNLKLACPKRPSLLLIWTVAPRLNQVWR